MLIVIIDFRCHPRDTDKNSGVKKPRRSVTFSPGVAVAEVNLSGNSATYRKTPMKVGSVKPCLRRTPAYHTLALGITDNTNDVNENPEDALNDTLPLMLSDEEGSDGDQQPGNDKEEKDKQGDNKVGQDPKDDEKSSDTTEPAPILDLDQLL